MTQSQPAPSAAVGSGACRAAATPGTDDDTELHLTFDAVAVAYRRAMRAAGLAL